MSDNKTSIKTPIDKIQDMLDEVNTNNRIPEDLFVNVFLNFFSNQGTLHQDATTEKWISIAGSPYRAVDVFDKNNKVIFTVPAMYNINAIAPDKTIQSMAPINHVIATYKQLSNRSVREAENYLYNSLLKHSKELNNKVDILADIKIWNDIFARYNLEPMLKLEVSQDIIDENSGKKEPVLDYDNDIEML